MRLDRTYYIGLMERIIEIFNEVFEKEIVFCEKMEHFEHMGCFQLLFNYRTLNYNIVFECERNVFNIQIMDSEGASNSLYRIEKYDAHVEIGNILKATKILKTVLERNDFNFYIYEDDKVYKKNVNGIKRIKNVKEISNG